MRTVKQTIDYLRAKDEGTALTEFFIRRLLHSGLVPYHRAGKKWLINLDALEAFLENPPEVEEYDITSGGIRKIDGKG